jgi:exopolysaccharide biosynthesis polyprenyl glycosylphosphotransferase
MKRRNLKFYNNVYSRKIKLYFIRFCSLLRIQCYKYCKRALDILIILLSTPFIIPFLLFIALLIKLESKGSVIFKQKRVGFNGKEFDFYKFRSMYSDAEDTKKSLMSKNESSDGVIFKIKNDPRVTRVGRIIRKLSIDELPQLYNVLRGDMTLVGPRPPVPTEVRKYSLDDFKRLEVTPGITCLWQVSGRSDIPFNKQVKLDVTYIRNSSIISDLVILVKTVPAVLLGKGAY